MPILLITGPTSKLEPTLKLHQVADSHNQGSIILQGRWFLSLPGGHSLALADEK